MGLFKFGKNKEGDPHSSSPAGSGNAESDRAQQESLIEEKQDMIKGVEDLASTSVREVMIPRIDVDFISIDTPEDELLEKIAESGHSRFPVYSESIDNVVGVLYVKDLIIAFSKKESIDLKKIIRKAHFVPESKRINMLLREFKRQHLHIAMAIDEYGGISGIICMEDIIEEIVGDIQDEFDNERADIVQLGEKVWLCDARTNLEDLNEALGSDFPSAEFDTLGGYVFDLFGKIPVQYERKDSNGWTFIVHDMEGHRINLIKVLKNEAIDEDVR